MGTTSTTGDPRGILLLSLYERGVFSFEQIHCWAIELGLDHVSRQRLLTMCVELHFERPSCPAT